jgi:hypothetical protein
VPTNRRRRWRPGSRPAPRVLDGREQAVDGTVGEQVDGQDERLARQNLGDGLELVAATRAQRDLVAMLESRATAAPMRPAPVTAAHPAVIAHGQP